MIRRQVVRGRKPVAAPADDHDVVAGFRLGRSPRARPRPTCPGGPPRIGKEKKGRAGVEVKKLRKPPGVSRGGFYWFFKSRKQLLDELLTYWADTSTVLFERV